MVKKTYQKPELKTRKIALGVFGNYSGNGNRNGGRVTPAPVEVVSKLNLHME